MKFKIEKNGFSDIITVSSDAGYLEFTPPDVCCNAIVIQNIKVRNKRQGEGTKLIEHLKKIVKEEYSSAHIEVMDINPLCDDISVEELIKFYERNNFKVKSNHDDISATFSFK